MGGWIKALVWAATVAAVVGGALYGLVFDVWRVQADDPQLSASILPTLEPGDVVLVARHSTISRGDLLRCPDPQAPGRYVVGRAMATGGERITIRSDVVDVDGRHLPSPRACDDPTMTVNDPSTNDPVAMSCGVEDFGEMNFGALRASDRATPPTDVRVDAGKWFLVSDDRHFHLDSRDYGQVDPAICQHIVFRLVGPKGFFDQKTRTTIIW